MSKICSSRGVLWQANLPSGCICRWAAPVSECCSSGKRRPDCKPGEEPKEQPAPTQRKGTKARRKVHWRRILFRANTHF